MAGREAACRKVLRLLEGCHWGQAPGWSRLWPGWSEGEGVGVGVGAGGRSTLQGPRPMPPSPHREFEDIRNSSFHLDMW